MAEQRWDQIDRENLSECLNDMALRDRREVISRLSQLIAHLLKWDHQPSFRLKSWSLTIDEQRKELRDMLESRTLQSYAEANLAKAYASGCVLAIAETGLAENAFPASWPYTVESLLVDG